MGKGNDLRYAFVGDGAIVHVLDGALQLLQTEKKSCTPRQHRMSQVLNTILLRPLLAALAAVATKICALGENEQPHGIEVV